MREWMRTGSAAVVAATLAGTGIAVAQQEQDPAPSDQVIGRRQQQPDAQAQPPQDDRQELDQTRRRERSEERAQGDRRVEVREQALWGLGELPPRLMHKAMETLAQEPEEARRSVMQAANILELQSALAQGRGAGAERLMQQAERLRELSRQIEFKQVLSRDDLKQPFADAALAAAAFYQEAAQAGLQRQDEEQTGYTLKGAAEYFTAAHAFGERQPTAQVSRAIFDADRLSAQIVKLSKPTTDQDERRSDDQVARGDNGGEAEGDLGDGARTAGARAGEPGAIPQEADRVIEALGDAIRAAGADAQPPRRTADEVQQR